MIEVPPLPEPLLELEAPLPLLLLLELELPPSVVVLGLLRHPGVKRNGTAAAATAAKENATRKMCLFTSSPQVQRVPSIVEESRTIRRRVRVHQRHAFASQKSPRGYTTAHHSRRGSSGWRGRRQFDELLRNFRPTVRNVRESGFEARRCLPTGPLALGRTPGGKRCVVGL
jgi:hypothetical protein